MIVDRVSYIIAMFKVYSAAAFLILILPMIIWKNFLRTKPYGYRFAFCVIVQNSFLINLVLVLGYFKVCNYFTVTLGIMLFSIIIWWSFADKKKLMRHKASVNKMFRVLRNTKSTSALVRDIKDSLVFKLKGVALWPLWQNIKENLFSYIALFVTLVYNTWFLNRGLLIHNVPQFPDFSVHQSWIYELSQGTLFSDGIYPFGMHAMIYLIHTMFSIELYDVLLFFGSFQTIILLICVFLLAKEIFLWKHSSVLAIILVSLLLNEDRYAASLPQENGMFAVALSSYFLIRFLHTPLQKKIIKQDSAIKRFFRINQYLSKKYMTMDTILFMLCVALTIAFHFYTAIAAILFLLAIVVAFFLRAIKKQYMVPILVSGMLGVLIAIVPFAASYMKGIPFQGSMQWALSIVKGEESAVLTDDTLAGQKDISISDHLSKNLLFGIGSSKYLFICLGVSTIFAVLSIFVYKRRSIGQNYISVILYTVFMCILSAAPLLGIMEIVQAIRARTFMQPFIGIMYAIPFDFIFGLLGIRKNRIFRRSLSISSVAICIALVFTFYTQGWVHEFFGTRMLRYNEPGYLLRNIRKKYEQRSYTIVSPTDEYYQVIEYGYHEELSTFMNAINKHEDDYYIPTPYVFIFIEKRALDDFSVSFGSFLGAVDVSLELASNEFDYTGSLDDYLYQRDVIQSQAFFWAKEFSIMYPNSCSVFFENDIYIAYIIRQNPNYLYDFGIEYLPKGGEEKIIRSFLGVYTMPDGKRSAQVLINGDKRYLAFQEDVHGNEMIIGNHSKRTASLPT